LRGAFAGQLADAWSREGTIKSCDALAFVAPHL
jgi:hypothetical protein